MANIGYHLKIDAYSRLFSEYSGYIMPGAFSLVSGYFDAMHAYKNRFGEMPSIQVPGLSAESTKNISYFVLNNALGQSPYSSFQTTLGLALYCIGGLILPFLYPSHSPDCMTFFIVDGIKNSMKGYPITPFEEKYTILPCFYPEFKTYGQGQLENKILTKPDKQLSQEEKEKATIIHEYSQAFDSYKEVLKARKRYLSRPFLRSWRYPDPLSGRELSGGDGLFYKYAEDQENEAQFQTLKFFSLSLVDRKLSIEVPAGYNAQEIKKHIERLNVALEKYENRYDSIEIIQEWSKAADAENLKKIEVPNKKEKKYLLLNPNESFNLIKDNEKDTTHVLSLGVDNPLGGTPGEHLSIPRTQQSLERWTKTLFALASTEIQTDLALFSIRQVFLDGDLRFLLKPKTLISALLSVRSIALKITMWPIRLGLYGLSLLWLKLNRKDRQVFEMPNLDSEKDTLRYPAQLQKAPEQEKRTEEKQSTPTPHPRHKY